MSESQFTSLSSDDMQLIEARIASLRDWYGAFELSPINACSFDGGTNDVCALDYIFYELGGTSWSWDDGLTHSIAWGNVAVRRFGFQWCKFAGDASPRQFVLRNPEVPCILFPWPRLYELVENPGRHDSAHAYLLLSTISDIDQCSVVPRGWHPALDAIEQTRSDFPDDVVAMLRRLYDDDPQWIHHLGMSPYDWQKDMDWNVVRSTLQSWISSGLHQSFRSRYPDANAARREQGA